MITEIGQVRVGNNPVSYTGNVFILSDGDNPYSGWEYLYAKTLADNADVFRGWMRGITGSTGEYKAGTLSFKCSVNIGSEKVEFSGVEASGSEYRLVEKGAINSGREFRVEKIERGTPVFLLGSDGQRRRMGVLSLRMYVSSASLDKLVTDDSFLSSVSSETLSELFARKVGDEYQEYIHSVEALPALEVIDLAPVIARLKSVVDWSRKGRLSSAGAKRFIRMDNVLFEIGNVCEELGEDNSKTIEAAIAAMFSSVPRSDSSCNNPSGSASIPDSFAASDNSASSNVGESRGGEEAADDAGLYEPPSFDNAEYDMEY